MALLMATQDLSRRTFEENGEYIGQRSVEAEPNRELLLAITHSPIMNVGFLRIDKILQDQAVNLAPHALPLFVMRLSWCSNSFVGRLFPSKFCARSPALPRRLSLRMPATRCMRCSCFVVKLQRSHGSTAAGCKHSNGNAVLAFVLARQSDSGRETCSRGGKA